MYKTHFEQDYLGKPTFNSFNVPILHVTCNVYEGMEIISGHVLLINIKKKLHINIGLETLFFQLRPTKFFPFSANRLY